MKKKLVPILILLTGIYNSIDARIGCEHNSYDLHQIDYKNWHPVDCNCNCEKAYKILEGGLCDGCRHRHTDSPLNAHPNISNTQALIARVNIEALRKKSKQKPKNALRPILSTRTTGAAINLLGIAR